MTPDLAVDDKGKVKDKSVEPPKGKIAAIVKQERKVALAEKNWESAKAEAREAHGAYDGELKKLRAMIAESAPGTFDFPEADPQDVEAARAAPLPDDPPAAKGAKKKAAKKK